MQFMQRNFYVLYRVLGKSLLFYKQLIFLVLFEVMRSQILILRKELWVYFSKMTIHIESLNEDALKLECLVISFQSKWEFVNQQPHLMFCWSLAVKGAPYSCCLMLINIDWCLIKLCLTSLLVRRKRYLYRKSGEHNGNIFAADRFAPILVSFASTEIQNARIVFKRW